MRLTMRLTTTTITNWFHALNNNNHNQFRHGQQPKTRNLMQNQEQA